MKAFDENGPTSYDLEGLTEYYTEYPTTTFRAINDEVALKNTAAKVVYREHDDRPGFYVLRDTYAPS